MQELTLLAMKCPNCGAPLNIRPEIQTFACAYCGSSVQVHRGGGVVSLHLIKDVLEGVRQGTDRTAAELAIRRLSAEVELLEREKNQAAASREDFCCAWKEKPEQQQATRPRGPTVLMSGVLAAIFVALLGWSAKIPLAVVFPLALIALFGAMIWMSSALARETESALTKAQAELQKHLTRFDTAHRALEARIEVAQAKLAKNKLLVD